MHIVIGDADIMTKFRATLAEGYDVGARTISVSALPISTTAFRHRHADPRGGCRISPSAGEGAQ